jgi:MFS family permease
MDPDARQLGPNYLSAPSIATATEAVNGGSTPPTVDLPPTIDPPAEETAAPPHQSRSDAAIDGNGKPPSSNGAATSPPDAPPPRKPKASLRGAFAAFQLPDFRYLTLSTIAVGFGQWAQQIGIFWLILELTGSAVQLGALAATRGLIGTAVAPIGGLLAEKYPRRAVMVWSTFAGGAQAAVLAALVITETVEVWHVYVFALIAGTTMSINQPTRQALVYDVTSDELLPNAVAMNSAAQNVSRVAGPPLAGALIGFFGVASAFVFIVVARGIAVLLTLMISHRTRQVRLRGDTGSALRQMGEGFRYSWNDKPIFGLIVVSAIPSLLVYPYIPFMATFSNDVFGRGAQGFGLLTSMLGWGSIVGLMLLAVFSNVPRKGLIMMSFFTIYALLLVAFSWSPIFYLSLAILAVAGIFHAIAMALNNTLLQLAVRNDMRGRVMSVFQMSHGLQPLGSLPMGLLVASQGPQIGVGAFMVAASVIFVFLTVFWVSLRRL